MAVSKKFKAHMMYKNSKAVKAKTMKGSFAFKKTWLWPY